MANVTVFTADRMAQIESQAITDARLDGTNLVLVRNDLTEVNVGNVQGPTGSTPTVPDELDWNVLNRVTGAAPTGGAGVPTLKMQAGTGVHISNTSGTISISFPETFTGVGSVVAQVGDTSDPYYTHINGAGSYPDTLIGIGNINLVTGSYSGTGFVVKLFTPGGASDYGNPLPDATVGGCGPIRINWMAFGW